MDDSGDADDVNYLFNAIQPEIGGEIIQPVLDWNSDFNPWSYESAGAAWEYDSRTDYDHSEYIRVSPNQSIKGSLDFPEHASYWSITFTNQTTDNSTSLWADQMEDVDMTDDNIYTTLEGYNLEDTPDLYGTCDFHDMKAMDYLTELDITWTGYIDPDDADYLNGLYVDIISDSHVQLETGS